MAGKLEITLINRTFHFGWCNRTEVDAVCAVCGAIVPGESCIHCERTKAKKAESLRKFLASKEEGN